MQLAPGELGPEDPLTLTVVPPAEARRVARPLRSAEELAIDGLTDGEHEAFERAIRAQVTSLDDAGGTTRTQSKPRSSGQPAHGARPVPPPGQIQGLNGILGAVTMADELLEQKRLRRRAGDPRVTESGREIVRRLTTGDLADEFQRSLDEIAEADPMLSGNGDASD